MWLLFHETFPAQEHHKTALQSLDLLHRFAFFLCSMGLLCSIYCIASTRTNLVFFFIFLLLVATFGYLAGAF